MKRLSILIMSLIVAGTVVFAHEGNEHVRGVVTQLSPQSITLQTPDKKVRVLAITSKTTFQRSGKTAHLADLNVGDRVVIDVPEKTADALLVQIGAASAPAQAKAAASTKIDIVFQSLPKPAKTGENTFEVTVTDAARKPVTDADVSVLLVMPAMPAMKMPEMRNEVKLKSAGAGKYSGTGQVMVAGTWNVTISVKEDGKEIGQKKLTLMAK